MARLLLDLALRHLTEETGEEQVKQTEKAHLWELGTAGVVSAGIFAWLASLIAIFQIAQHLKYYDDPVIQRYYIRIIFLVPNLSLASWFSLVYPGAGEYIATVRDIYEAFVIYTFMALLLEYIGGPGSVESFCVDKVVEPSWLHGTCCMPAMAVNGQFVRTCKQMVLQFVIIKPILAALTIVLYNRGLYTEGDWSFSSSYLYIQVVYNVCYAIALLGLLEFYLGTNELLRPYKPLMKFVLVKLVVFLTFWQGFFLSAVFAGSHEIDAKPLQNWLICLEMLPAAFGMLIAFPFADYKVKGIQATSYRHGVAHVISIGDVVQDLRHQFMPTYRSYTSYKSDDSDPKKPPTTYRAKTYIVQDPAQLQIISEVKEDIAERGRRTTDSNPTGERPSQVALTDGVDDMLYPRATVSDFLNDDPIPAETGLSAPPDAAPLTRQHDVEVGETRLDLLTHADVGAVPSSAPAVYKGAGGGKSGKEGRESVTGFQDVAL